MTATTATLLFTGISKTDGGTTTTITDEATARDGAEATPATDRREESRRETHLLLRRMADCYRQPRHFENRQRRVPDPVHESSAGIGISHSASPSVGGSNEGYRLRSVRFDDQRSNRIREWARLFKPVVRHSEKDGRPTPSTQPTPPQRIPPSTAFQNGDDPTRVFRTKPERLLDFDRPERCLSPRPNPPRFETVSPVPLERTAIPIQGSSVRTLTGSVDIHEGSQTPLALGKTQGYSDISVPGRSHHRSGDQGEIPHGHRDGVTQTEELGLLNKASQVQFNTVPDASTSGVRNRHDDDDTQGSRSEDSRRTTRSLQVGEQGDMHSTSTLLIHRQSHRYDSRCLPSTSEGSASSSRQDPCAQIGIALGELDLSLAGSNRRTPLVAHKPATMERALMDHVDSTKGRLHGRLGLRMGNSSGQQIVQRIMVTSTPVETHQLQGVDDSLYRPSPTRSTRTHNQHNLGQHHDHSIHQPLRRDTVTGSDGAGDIVMGVVSEDRNEDQDDLRSIGIQSCRRTITTTNRATRMVHQQRMLSTIGRNMGTTPRRSLRLTRKPPTLSVYDLEAHNRRHRTRRSSTPLETTGQRLLMPSMESHPSHAAEDQTGEDHCNNSDTSVANSGVVPNDQDDGNCSTNLDTSPPSVAGPGKRPRHTGKEPPLVVMRLEGKRRRLLAKGWDPATASIVVDSPEMKGRQRSYARVQDRYIQWATARGVDAMEPQPAQLLNWLASGVSINNWSSTTVSSYKVAVIQMYEDKTSFDDPDFNLFFKTLRRRQIKHTKELNIDIKPVVDYLLGLGPNEGLSISDLTKKLCWLLGTCGFLRPNDIECIDLSNNKFRVDRVAAILPIMIPKETRGGMRVCRYTTVKGHEDPLLCPVKALSEYLRRIEGHDDTFPHPKDPTVQYRPLIRDVRDMSRPVVTDTISNHIASISGKLALPDGEKLPRARALGSTAAIQQGASVDDVVVHGNWSSSVLFDKFYRLHAATKTNFTSMVLA